MNAERAVMENNPWGNLSTSLVVTGPGVDSASLLAELHLGDSEEALSSEGVGTYSGPGWATLTVHDRHAKSADEQAAELLELLSSRKAPLDALKQAGNAVKVDVSGVAEPGTALVLSPTVLAGLAELGIPVTFTTVTESGEDPEDPLAWLDD
ncbi:hypothetical protein [Streptomyces sp. SID4982]|uniref:hypothetical protein n=1 Tax=Streptomyces sp. SID4982 TaxID=2690291 RepID=UPI00136BC579|nr:hypothetical protein [Streptomyces sp. SID4982]MYS17828.1 hypothetical protein [Streptomyces sp. SID4982]